MILKTSLNNPLGGKGTGRQAKLIFKDIESNFTELKKRTADIRDYDVSSEHDSTTALNLAVTETATAGVKLLMHGGIIPISASIVIKSNTDIEGGQSVLNLQSGSNCAILESEGFRSLVGTGSLGGTENVFISDLYGEGNKQNQNPSSPDIDFCNGMNFYGSKPYLRNVRFTNIRSHGFRTEWGQYGEPIHGMEAHIYDISVDSCGRHGWWNKGPHDMVTFATHVIDASQEADNTFSGYYAEDYGSSKHFGFHAWCHSYTTARPKYQAYSSTRTRWISPEFEGGRSQYFGAVSDKLICPEFYGHFGGTDSVMATLCGDTQMIMPEFKSTNENQAYGLQIGTAEFAAGLWSVQQALMYNFSKRSPVRFVNDGGYGDFQGKGFSAWDGTAGPWSFPGTVGNLTKLRYIQGGNPYNISVG